MRLVAIKPLFPELTNPGYAIEYFAQYKNFTRARHTVDVTLISCALSGKAQYIGDNPVPEDLPKTGWIGIAYPGSPLNIITDATGLEIFNVYINRDAMALPPLAPGSLETLKGLFSRQAPASIPIERRIDVSKEQLHALRGILNFWSYAQTQKNEQRPQLLRTALMGFLQLLSQLAEANGVSKQKAKGNRIPPWLDKLLDQIATEFSSPMSLDAIAAEYRMAPESLCRSFKKHTGQTLFSNIIQHRIENAQWLLSTSDTKIVEIAYQSGFSDLAHFNRTFKKATGITPSQFRKSVLR